MILVTGGAGFIGSNLQAALVRAGLETIVVDELGCKGKWRNLASHPPDRIIVPAELDRFLEAQPPLEMVFHMGAISSTSAVDGDLWQRRRGLRRRQQSRGIAAFAAAEPLWLDQTRLRPDRRAAARQCAR